MSYHDHIAFATLTDYVAGELSDDEQDAVEAHVFSCADCAVRVTELDGLIEAVQGAAKSAGVAGFVTEAALNQLARDGIRVRTFVLTPDAMVPCAVWEGDELMALRLRGPFGDADEFTMSQSVDGSETVRATIQSAPGPTGELTYIVPAAWIRRLPATEVDVRLVAHQNGVERAVARYTLVHGGAFHRER